MNNYVDVKTILYNSISKSYGIIPSMTFLMIGYWLQDVIFYNNFSKFTADVPKFIKNMTTTSVISLLSPYLIAEFLFYINNLIVSRMIPEIELSVVKQITEETLESIKTNKTPLNINEFIMNLKKVMDSKILYYFVVSYVVPTVLIAIGMIYYFMLADVKMGFIIMAIIFVFFAITFFMCMSSVEASKENEDELNLFYDDIQDIMSNADTVITTNSKNKEIENIQNSKNKAYKKYVNSELVSSDCSYQLRIFGVAVALLIIGLAVYLYRTKSMSEELLITTCLISITFINYYEAIIGKFKSSVGYIGKFYEIENYFKEFKLIDRTNDKKLNVTKGDITFENVGLKYEGKSVFNNLSFKVEGGSKVEIVGEMGSGKTTILKIIAGLIDYDGNVYIDGQNIKHIDYDSIMDNVVYIAQHPKLFNKTILYNLTYGTDITEQQVWSFLQKINFTDFFNQFPNKLHTKVGKEGKKISGGQKQILVVIRSLLQNKSIILLDEPTSSLDSKTKQMLIKLLKDLQNKTIIVVSHDITIDNIFDTIIKVK